MIFWKRKLLALFILVNLLDISSGYTRKKVCNIKFNVQGTAKELENKINLQKSHKSFKRNSDVYCYQIGLEHDANQQPISSKPIYACCRN